MRAIRVALWSEALVGAPNGTRTMLLNLTRHWILDHAGQIRLTLVVRSAQEAAQLEGLLPAGNWQVAILPRRKWALRLAWLIGAASLTKTIGAHDIYLSGWHWPLGRRDTPFVAILHDLRLLDPEWRDSTISAGRRMIWRMLYHVSAVQSLRRAAAVVTPSEYTLRHIGALGFRPRQPTHVIAHGIDHGHWQQSVEADDLAQVRGLAGLPRDARYVLTIGPHTPHKNIPLLVTAFASGLAQQDPTAHLLLVGRRNSDTLQIESLIALHKLQQRVHILGQVPEAQLSRLMLGARVFAFVSRFEGFGLPVAEAFAAGIPVLTSNTTALAEVAGDAALTADPDDVGSVSAGLMRLWGDEALRSALITRGSARSMDFRWDQAAARYLNLFRQISEVCA